MNSYYKNVRFFETWTPDMAYVLGFITADGCISDRSEVIIGIHQNDVAILEYIKMVMEIDHTIGYSDRRNRKMATLRFTSRKICDDLKVLNVTPRKTYDVVAPPFIPDDMVSHYIRGVFDGDGGIYLSNRHKQVVAEVAIATASEVYGNQLHRMLLENDISNNLYTKEDCRTNTVPIYKVTMGGKNVVAFGEFIYEDAPFCLKRKYDKFQTFYGGRFVNCLLCNEKFFRTRIDIEFCQSCHDLVVRRNYEELSQLSGIPSETLRRAGRVQYVKNLKKVLVLYADLKI